jgi:hypothetical protein
MGNPIKFINIKGQEQVGYKFKFRRTGEFVRDYEGNSYTRTNAGGVLITTKKQIPNNAKFLNLIESTGIDNLNSKELVEKRNNFIHPDLVENNSLETIELKDCLDLAEVCFQLYK